MIATLIKNTFLDVNDLIYFFNLVTIFIMFFFFTELVTASGDVIKASENENQELFWGMKGCGSNFG